MPIRVAFTICHLRTLSQQPTTTLSSTSPPPPRPWTRRPSSTRFPTRPPTHPPRSTMARGHQKIQSQQKAAEKQAKLKKQQGHSANDQKKAAMVALKSSCAVCKVRKEKLETF